MLLKGHHSRQCMVEL